MALALYQELVAVYERMELRPEQARSFDAIGIIHEECDRLPCALQAYRTELELLEEANDTIGAQLTHMTLSRVYQRMECDEMAEQSLLRAQQLANQRNLSTICPS